MIVQYICIYINVIYIHLLIHVQIKYNNYTGMELLEAFGLAGHRSHSIIVWPPSSSSCLLLKLWVIIQTSEYYNQIRIMSPTLHGVYASNILSPLVVIWAPCLPSRQQESCWIMLMGMLVEGEFWMLGIFLDEFFSQSQIKCSRTKGNPKKIHSTAHRK